MPIRFLKPITVLAFLSLSACANVPGMYQDFENSAKSAYPDAAIAFQSVKPSDTRKLSDPQLVPLSKGDPILLLDKEAQNKGYFKVVEFEITQADTYEIRGILDCRCFGKLSGKNVVVPRLFLKENATGKITASHPGLLMEYLNVWDGGYYYNGIEAALKPGKYSLIVAADNATKGHGIYSYETYAVGASVGPIPMTISISAAPDGNVKLLIEPKKKSS